MNPTLFYYDNPGEFIEDAVDGIESFIAYQLEQKEGLRIALSGGNSPKEVYKRLAKSDQIDWRRVELFQVDERSDGSNLKMIEGSLLSGIKSLRTFHSFDTSMDLQQAADAYDAVLRRYDSPLFDLVILGLGEDGHTASLFPGSPALGEQSKLAVYTQAKNHEPKDRLTLTFPAILDSARIMFLVRDKQKESVMNKWLDGSALIQEIPAVKILEHPHVDIYFDRSE